MRYPAALPAITLAAGIALGIFSPINSIVAHGLLPVTWAFAAATFIFELDRAFLVHVCVGFVIAGELLGSSAHHAAVDAPIGSLFDRHLPAGEFQLSATVDGVLKVDATRGANGVTLNLDADRFVFEGGRRRTSGGVVVGVGGDLTAAPVEEWRQGRRVRVQASVRRPAKYLDPGVPDAQRDFAWRGTSLVGSVKSPRLVEVIEEGSLADEWLAAIRWNIRRAVSGSVGRWGERSAAVVTAILIGDRAGLDDEMQRQLQDAGTYHVIAISGGNIAILAALCVFVLRLCGAAPRSTALTIIVILVLYACVVGGGGGASVGRATLMAVIYFGAQLADHRSAAGNVAALSAAALFCVSPLEVVDASFALTFGATLGLIVGMPRFPRPKWMPAWIFTAVALFAASVCAEIALLPVSAFVFSRVTAAGLILNFAAIPLMTVVQIAGMVVVVLEPINAYAAQWAGFIAHLGVRGLLASASLVDLAPWVARRVPPPSIVLIAAYYLSLALALTLRRRSLGLLCGVLTVLSGWLMVTTVEWSRPTRSTLRVTFLDVGQGDAAIVSFPDGRSLSIDAGGIAGTTFDIGGRVVSPALWALGVRRLTYMSISHSDPDHIGGAASVFRDFHPFEVWEGVPVPRNEPTRRLKALSAASGANWRTVFPGHRFEFGGANVTVHHPPIPDWERQRVRNDDSEVLEIRYGDVSIVFTGDIGREVEREIVASFEPAAIRILKVPHHGSGTSSSIEFLRALQPNVAVISAGRGNPFGHPVPSVLTRYNDIGAAIFRTDRDGAVTVKTDGHTASVTTFTGRRLFLYATSKNHNGTTNEHDKALKNQEQGSYVSPP